MKIGNRNFINGQEIFHYKELHIIYDKDSDSFQLHFRFQDIDITEPQEAGVSFDELDSLGAELQLALERIKIQGKVVAENFVKQALSKFMISDEAFKLGKELIHLEALTDLDRPEFAGKLVSVKAVAASTSVSYNVPTQLTARCLYRIDKDDKEIQGTGHTCTNDKAKEIINLDSEYMARYPESSTRDTLNNNLVRQKTKFGKQCQVDIKEAATTTIYTIRVRPHVQSLITQKDRIIDATGREYKPYDIFLVNKDVVLEAGTVYELIGRVVPDVRTQRLTLFATEIRKVESEQFDLERINALKVVMHSLTIEQRKTWILSNFAKYAKVVKRDNLALAILLTAFSPLYITFDGKLQRGWLNTEVIGDSTTAKSESAKAMITLLKAGQMSTVEAASMIGLSGTVTQMRNSNWFIEWGLLVTNDRRLLIIDGAHKLRREQRSTIAEARRTGVIQIVKAARNEAYARTRQICIGNALAEDRLTTTSIENFYYKVQALQRNLDTVDIARLDLALFVPTDVKPTELNILHDDDYSMELHNLADLLQLIWQQRYAIKFEHDAITAILRYATALYNFFYVAELPLVSIDMKYKLARLSAAFAALTCSFNDDYSELTIKSEHVKQVVQFFVSEYENAGLHLLAKAAKDVVVDSKLVDEIVTNLIARQAFVDSEEEKTKVKKILQWVAQQTKFTRDGLKDKFELNDNAELRPLIIELRERKLIADASRGMTPTRIGIMLGKFIETDFIKANKANKAKKGIPHTDDSSLVYKPDMVNDNKLIFLASQLGQFSEHNFVEEAMKLGIEAGYVKFFLNRMNQQGRAFDDGYEWCWKQ